MFKYQDTKQISNLGEKQRKQVVKGRQVTYLNRYRIDGKTVEKISKGWEIVEERVVSPGFKAPEKIGLTGDNKFVEVNHKHRRTVKEEY
jgi:hypothetical protein